MEGEIKYMEIDVECVNFRVHYTYKDELLNIVDLEMEVVDDNGNVIFVDAEHFWDYFFSKEIKLEIETKVSDLETCEM